MAWCRGAVMACKLFLPPRVCASQEPVLLSGTLRENIAMGCPTASAEQIIDAARRAGCDFAEESWERPVGEQGIQLSGGQK